MNFVKIIFSGEHRIQEVDFGFLGPIHELYTNQPQNSSLIIFTFSDIPQIHEPCMKHEQNRKAENFLQNNFSRRKKYELRENNFLRRT